MAARYTTLFLLSSIPFTQPTGLPSRADLATVFRVKNSTCLGTGNMCLSNDRGEVLHEPVALSTFQDLSCHCQHCPGMHNLTLTMNHAAPCRRNSCRRRCVVVRHGSNRLEYIDALGSQHSIPYTQVHRRVIVLKYYDRIAVWIDGCHYLRGEVDLKQNNYIRGVKLESMGESLCKVLVALTKLLSVLIGNQNCCFLDLRIS